MDFGKSDLLIIEKGYSFDPFYNPIFPLGKSTITKATNFLLDII
jgi:hypothetical protein